MRPQDAKVALNILLHLSLAVQNASACLDITVMEFRTAMPAVLGTTAKRVAQLLAYHASFMPALHWQARVKMIVFARLGSTVMAARHATDVFLILLHHRQA